MARWLRSTDVAAGILPTLAPVGLPKPVRVAVGFPRPWETSRGAGLVSDPCRLEIRGIECWEHRKFKSVPAVASETVWEWEFSPALFRGFLFHKRDCSRESLAGEIKMCFNLVLDPIDIRRYLFPSHIISMGDVQYGK